MTLVRSKRAPLGVLLSVFALTPALSAQADTEGALALDEASSARAALAASAKGIIAYGDTDRDAVLTANDASGRNAWSWQRGAFVAANLDDDDRDGKSDAEDGVFNGASDERDLARAVLAVDTAKYAPSSHVLLLRLPVEQRKFVRVFGFAGGKWQALDSGNTQSFPLPSNGVIPLRVEAKTFAGTPAGWNGAANLEFIVRAANGVWVESDTVRMNAAPFLMLPNSARTQRFYVSSGAYANEAFLDESDSFLRTLGIPMTVHPAKVWQEMWMQDTMEIGYTQLPGGAVQHVTLGGLRGADTFGPKTLGPDHGYLQVGSNRFLSGPDTWADWYGNLEVSAPVPGWPLGRIYYGRNSTTGQTFHPAVIAFLNAQKVQGPFAVDTSWLTIKHVDEIFNFVPGNDGRPRLIVVSPREAGRLQPSEYGPYNKGIQAKIDATLADVRGKLSLSSDQIVELPVFFEEGHNIWSNPVNGVYLNGTALLGGTYMPDDVRNTITRKFSAVGVRTRFADDAVYQDNLGNVHCASNTLRTPVVAAWWKSVP